MRIAETWGREARELAILLAIGVFLAIIQPYGATSRLPLWAGVVYWAGLVLIGNYTARIARWAMGRQFPNLPVAAYLSSLSVITAIVVTLVLVLAERFVLRREIDPGFIPTLFGLVWIISAAMTGIGFLMERAFATSPGPPAESPEPQTAFLGPLPLKYRHGELYAVSAEDHYLRVHTSAGEALILMRLADAMRELNGAGGLQTHRSWWVSAKAVRDARREGGKVVLMLKSGAEAPVSRTFLPAVREAGLA